jgi:hypothetical protein
MNRDLDLFKLREMLPPEERERYAKLGERFYTDALFEAIARANDVQDAPSSTS